MGTVERCDCGYIDFNNCKARVVVCTTRDIGQTDRSIMSCFSVLICPKPLTMLDDIKMDEIMKVEVTEKPINIKPDAGFGEFTLILNDSSKTNVVRVDLYLKLKDDERYLVPINVTKAGQTVEVRNGNYIIKVVEPMSVNPLIKEFKIEGNKTTINYD